MAHMEPTPPTTTEGMPAGIAAPDRLGLGTVALRTDRLDIAFGILDTWLAAGGRLIDTAAVYGTGESERTIGAWLRDRGTRGEVELLTKGAHPDQRDWSSRMTPEAIEGDLAASLDRLGVPTVDAYLVHRDDPSVPIGVILEALAAQVSSGRARSYGVSNWTLARLDAALEYVDAHGLPALTWSSSYLGLASPTSPIWPGGVDACDDASRAWYASHATRLVAWSPGGNGFFVPGADLTIERFDRLRSAGNLARRERAAELAARRGVTMNQVALAWVLGQPSAPIVLIGTTVAGHLAEAIEATRMCLSADELRWLERG
jgi:aryl-alcohol dehydrogenase-like predicted oxidoreductase